MSDLKSGLFDFNSYQEFLIHQLGGKSSRRGLKTKLAEILNIKTSYLSRILNGESDLTLEQAHQTSQFFSLNTLEQEFFLALVSQKRAGSFELKQFYQMTLDRIKKESQKIEKRIHKPEALSEKDSLKYYSRWVYLAVHVAVSIPGLKSLRSIANKFSLNIDEAQEILDFLVQTNIISYDTKTRNYNVGPTYTHIGEHSDLVYSHHYNWRIKALENISKKDPKALHYSALFSLSKEDALKLKNNFLELIKNHVEILKPSKEEVLYCQVIDFFEL